MSKTIGVFGISISKMAESGRPPVDPFVHICLERWSTTEEDVPTLSPELKTKSEIDNHIRSLKEDLDNVGRRAKAALKAAQTSTQEIVASRSSN